mgnify:CR=1 FL=1
MENFNLIFPDNITKLHFAIIEFRTEILQDCKMPVYKGSVIRGALGYCFRQTVCTRPLCECNTCVLHTACPYACVFESFPFPSASMLSKYHSVPQPFILEPPADGKSFYNKGEPFNFKIILIGKAIQYIPYFIHAFKEAGFIGLGTGREGKYHVKSVVNYNFLLSKWSVLYNGQSKSVKSPEYIIRVASINEVIQYWEEISEVTLTFLTPVRIKYRAKLVDYLEFHIFMRSFLRRLSAIFYFHCGEKLLFDYRKLVEYSKTIDMVYSDLHWEDVECYSSRQKELLRLGGFKGTVRFQGNLKDFIVFIMLGQYFHLGKGITYGLGKYEVKL